MKKLKYWLIVEGIFAFGLALYMYFFAGFKHSMYLLSIPFDLIGKGIRWLSLSSYAGNMVAFFLYAVICLLPIIYLLLRRVRIGLTKADFLLPLISIYSYYMLYELINPRLMQLRIPDLLTDEAFLPIIKLSFVLIFYSLCFGYIILRFSENLAIKKSEDKLSFLCKKMINVLEMASFLYCFLFSYFASFQIFEDLNKCMEQGNISINMSFAVLSYLLKGLPIVFSIITLLAGIRLLNAMIVNHLQKEESTSAMQMGIVSKRTIYVTVISNITLNASQFLFAKQLSNTDYTLEISFIPLIIAFSAMILSRYFKESKELHEDNEMII